MRLASLAILPLLTVPTAGPVLTPDGAVWAEQDGPVAERIVGATPPRVLHRLQGTDRRGRVDLLTVGLSGTGEGFVFSADAKSGTVHQTCGSDCFSPVYADVGLGSSAGVRYVASDRCEAYGSEASSEVIAYSQPRCGPRGVPVVTVRDAAGALIHTAVDAGGAQVAGRLVGWTTSGLEATGVIFDTAARREVARFRGLSLADLQPDGKALLVAANRAASWASVDDPTPRRLPLRLSGRGRIEGDRVLAADGPQRLVLVGLDGSRRTVVDLRGDERFNGSFDLAGDRVAWSRATCAGSEIRVQAASARVALSSRPRCPTVLAAPPRATADGIYDVLVKVPVRCHDASLRPCGDVTITTARPVRLGRRGPRVVVVGEIPYEGVLDGAEASLSPQAERLLARTGRLRVRVALKGAAPAVTTLRASPAALRVARRGLRRR